jgi:short-subunit dehydrogenase
MKKRVTKEFSVEFSIEGYAELTIRARNLKEAKEIAEKLRDNFRVDYTCYDLKNNPVIEASDNLEAEIESIDEDN